LGHKADESFFLRKRPWSKRKDDILGYYLEPYLAKVARLGRRIILVDGFAGPGVFADGSVGSPLIICTKAQAAIDRGANVSVWCIEADSKLFASLDRNLAGFPFARAINSTLADSLPQVAEVAATHTLFLYLDPFTVDGLDWRRLDSVFRHVKDSRMSIEVLLNFNAPIFVRCALAALRAAIPEVDPSQEDPEEIDAPMAVTPTINRLDQIVGGNWWMDTLRSTRDFADQVRVVTNRLCAQLKERFAEVGFLPVKAKAEHRIPKYYLVFASRSTEGLLLMNDAMVRSRGQSIFFTDMFSRLDLQQMILREAARPIPRGQLITSVIRKAFCIFEWKEIRGMVEELLKDRRLLSATGKTKINDTVKVWSV